MKKILHNGIVKRQKSINQKVAYSFTNEKYGGVGLALISDTSKTVKVIILRDQ